MKDLYHSGIYCKPDIHLSVCSKLQSKVREEVFWDKRSISKLPTRSTLCQSIGGLEIKPLYIMIRIARKHCWQDLMCQEKIHNKKQRKITNMREAGNRRKQEEFLHEIDYIFDCTFSVKLEKLFPLWNKSSKRRYKDLKTSWHSI